MGHLEVLKGHGRHLDRIIGSRDDHDAIVNTGFAIAEKLFSAAILDLLGRRRRSD